MLWNHRITQSFRLGGVAQVGLCVYFLVSHSLPQGLDLNPPPWGTERGAFENTTTLLSSPLEAVQEEHVRKGHQGKNKAC